MDNKILVILGMHRSGTSLVANWLYAMRLNLGYDLLDGGIGNVKGHFEDRGFHDLHEFIFRKNNISYGGLKPPLHLNLDRVDKSKIKDLIKRKNNSNIQWGWKEPRTCLFLNEYKELLPNAKYLIVFRNCNEVVNSLIRREIKFFDKKFPNKNIINRIKFLLFKKKYHNNIYLYNRTHFVKTWEIYNRAILDFVSTLSKDSFIVVDKKKILSQDDIVFNKLHNDWKFDIEYRSILDIYENKLFNSDEELSDVAYISSNIDDIEKGFQLLM